MTDEPSSALTLQLFWESWDLFKDAVLAGTVAGGLLGFLGVYVTTRRMVFLSSALSQTAGLGVALAFYAQIHWGVAASVASPTLGAILATAVATLGLMLDRRSQGNQRDSLLGAIFLLGSAGTILLGTKIVQELQDVQALLFGTAVAVLPEHLHLLLGVAAALGALHLWWWRGFVSVSLDPEGSQVRRLPARALEAALLLGLALAISTSTRVLGALPTFAFSVLPALVATRVAPNLPRALWVAALLGAACGFGGYVLAFLYELPVGATQAALGVAGFALVGLARRAWGLARR